MVILFCFEHDITILQKEKLTIRLNQRGSEFGSGMVGCFLPEPTILWEGFYTQIWTYRELAVIETSTLQSLYRIFAQKI